MKSTPNKYFVICVLLMTFWTAGLLYYSVPEQIPDERSPISNSFPEPLVEISSFNWNPSEMERRTFLAALKSAQDHHFIGGDIKNWLIHGAYDTRTWNGIGDTPRGWIISNGRRPESSAILVLHDFTIVDHGSLASVSSRNCHVEASSVISDYSNLGKFLELITMNVEGLLYAPLDRERLLSGVELNTLDGAFPNRLYPVLGLSVNVTSGTSERERTRRTYILESCCVDQIEFKGDNFSAKMCFITPRGGIIRDEFKGHLESNILVVDSYVCSHLYKDGLFRSADNPYVILATKLDKFVGN